MPDHYTAKEDQTPETSEAGPDRLGHACSGVIPNTFIACGEGDEWTRFYCSDTCMARDEDRRSHGHI